MIREEFNKLDINSQVNYFNNELKQENNNFNAICKQLGISKNTILNRFKDNGFEPSRAGQKIIAFSQLVEVIVPSKFSICYNSGNDSFLVLHVIVPSKFSICYNSGT